MENGARGPRPYRDSPGHNVNNRDNIKQLKKINVLHTQMQCFYKV